MRSREQTLRHLAQIMVARLGKFSTIENEAKLIQRLSSSQEHKETVSGP